MKHFVMLKPDASIPIPPSIARCPYCKTPLTATVEEWTHDDDQLWMATSISVDCATEPDIDDAEAWDHWINTHYQMPYVYLLPVEVKILDWMQRRYRFTLEASP